MAKREKKASAEDDSASGWDGVANYPQSRASRAHAQEEVAAVWTPIGELSMWEDNPRINDEAAKDVAKSIERFGFSAPVVARTNGEIIAGHTRVKAANMLGLDRVPVRFMSLDPAEAHLLALADNRLSEKAEWDVPKLQELLSGFSLPDVEAAGWSKYDLDRMAAKLTEEAGDDSDKLKEGFDVLIECEDEEQQVEVLKLCQERGLKCRTLT